MGSPHEDATLPRCQIIDGANRLIIQKKSTFFVKNAVNSCAFQKKVVTLPPICKVDLSKYTI